MARSRMVLWIASAFWSAFLLATIVVCFAGTGQRGIDAALAITGRLSFLLFWPAYTGGALVVFFGPRFRRLQRNGRAFGLAFASAHLVHLALVGWLYRIGAPPGTSTFVLFGVATVCLYLLAALSIDPVRQRLDLRIWSLLRLLTMNYIAFAFAVDFLRPPLWGGIRHSLEYWPFAALSILGPLLRLGVFIYRSQLQIEASVVGVRSPR